MWHIFFFLTACETLYLSLMCWNFTVINLVRVFHLLCRTCVGLSYSLVWETFLDNFIFSSCSGASTIWMWELLVWSKFLICLLLFFFYVSGCSVSREMSLFYCRSFLKVFLSTTIVLISKSSFLSSDILNESYSCYINLIHFLISLRILIIYFLFSFPYIISVSSNSFSFI